MLPGRVFLQVNLMAKISTAVVASEFCRLLVTLFQMLEQGQFNSEQVLAIFTNEIFGLGLTFEDGNNIFGTAAFARIIASAKDNSINVSTFVKEKISTK